MTTTQILLPPVNFNGQSLKLPDECGPTVSDHTKQQATGSLLLGITRRIRRLSYLSSSLFPSGKANVIASIKSLNELPNRRVFTAAEKWMVRST